MYLITLESDNLRRKVLEKNFPKNYKNFNIVYAVDGRVMTARDYFLDICSYFKQYKQLMSPAELGCTLSHVNALNLFLQSGCEKGLILEDDVIGNDHDLEVIKSIANKLPDNSLLICGAQDGIKNNYLFGRYSKDKCVYELANFSYSHIFRTCCYVVTRKSALAMIEYQKKNKTLADKWGEFFTNTDIKILYKNIMAHPIDLTQSHIESERTINDLKKIDKLFSLEVVPRILNKIRNFLYYYLYKILPFWKKIN